ncbi:MAG TPA: hypothetical protein VF006_18430 [Longimicrobium sp.]
MRNEKVDISPTNAVLENSFAEPTREEAFLAREGLDGLSLIEWMTMTQ